MSDLDPNRKIIENRLKLTLRGMVLTYLCFTVGWLLFLFSGHTRAGLALMLGPATAFWVVCRVRDRGIRKLGYSQEKPYPAEWRFEYYDRETEIFKVFTTVWTLAFFAWAFLKAR